MTGPAAWMAVALAGFATWLALPASADRRLRRVSRARGTESAPTTDESRPSPSGVAAVLDLLAAAFDVGLAPSAALAAVARGLDGAAQARLRRAAAMADMGSTDVWQLLASDPLLGPLAQALERSERSGAPVATTARSLADACRLDDRATRLAAARRVGIRTAVPLGACFLPAFFLIAIVPTVIALLGEAF